MVRWKVELHLPLLVVGAEDIHVKFARRRREAGPYLIISRACGYALDADQRASGPGQLLIVFSPHAQPNQLWYLRPTGMADEVSIISAANGMAVDATQETAGDPHPVLSEPGGAASQRWQLEAAPDGTGHLLQSVHSRRYLTANEGTQRTWNPWFEARHGHMSQQWIFAVPHGRPPKPR